MISVLSINCFSIHVDNDPYEYCTGCALYGYPSFFNHSCEPNGLLMEICLLLLQKRGLKREKKY